MRLILFLGAGVSWRSGLPMADGLTTKVLRSPYRQVGVRRFAPGRQTDRALKSTDATPRIRALLRLLKAHDERDRKRVGYYRAAKAGPYRSSGAIYRGRTTYEDLFHLCQQISLWNIGLVSDSLTTPLMEAIERSAGALLRGRSVTARLSDLASLRRLMTPPVHLRLRFESAYALSASVLAVSRDPLPFEANLWHFLLRK